MTLTTPFTELEAVNEMLASIGQAPVNTLANTGIGDVNIARSELAKATRFVQLQGFAFNTDKGYVFQPQAGTNLIPAPSGMLRFDPCDRTRNISVRTHSSGQLVLWDADALSFEFSEPFTGTIVWGFGFENLPESARAYIAIAAARKFQIRFVGSRELDLFNAEDEKRAWALLQRDERAVSDTNLFRKSPSLARAYNRSRWMRTP